MNPEVPELTWDNLPLFSCIAQLHSHILNEWKTNRRIVAPQNKKNLRHDTVDDEWLDWLEDEVSRIWKQEYRHRCGGGRFPWTRYEVFNAVLSYFKSKGGPDDPWKTGAYSAGHVAWVKGHDRCQNTRCDRLCQTISVDHWTAKSRGGPNDIENYRLLCTSCNSSKGAMESRQWVKHSKGSSTTQKQPCLYRP